MIAEADRRLNETLRRWLSDADYECRPSYDGQEALRLVDEVSPDALVLDLNVPRVPGLEVLRTVKERKPDTVVLVMTGAGGEPSVAQTLSLGADEWLSKPVTRELVAERLKARLELAERDRALDASGGWLAELPPEDLVDLFASAPAALVGADPDGRILAVNRAAARQLGRRADELLGRSVGELVSEEVRAAWVDRVRSDVRSGHGYRGEVLLNRPAGSRVPVAVVAEQAGRGRLVFSLRDLAGQKRLEEECYESRKLASLGKVVEGVAHEVRNPLISIGGFARKLRRLTDAEGGKYLDVILSEVCRLEKMVSDIEAYVQFTKEHRPRFRPVDVTGLLKDVVTEAGERLRDGGIRFQFDSPADVPQIYADPDLLRGLFSGLVENACDAMPRGGVLKIPVEVSGHWLLVRVADTGVGIPEENLPEIFDPFVTSKTSGAGLGLTKAYMIVEEHGGRIEFESQVGKGSTCTVTLPIDRRHLRRARGSESGAGGSFSSAPLSRRRR